MMNKLRIILSLPNEIWKMVISYIPGQAGYKIRSNYWKKRLKYLGRNVKIDVGVHFTNPEYISIGTMPLE